MLAAIILALVLAQQAPGPTPGAQAPPAQTQGNASSSRAASAEFSPAVADELLRTLRAGLLARSSRRFLSAFDAARFPEYNRFAERIESHFGRQESFRVYFRLLQTSSHGTRAVALVATELEARDRDALAPPARRSAQLRLEMERTAQGWRIVALTPSDFFFA